LSIYRNGSISHPARLNTVGYFLTASSDAIFPSRIKNNTGARLRNVVLVGDENNRIPWLCRFLNSAMISSPVFESRFPVARLQEQSRGIDERSRDRNTLALAAGEFVRLVTHAARKIDALDAFLAFSHALFRRRSVINQRQFDVVQRGGARQKIECLDTNPISLLRM